MLRIVVNNDLPAEWTAFYWQWIMSIPKGENPLRTGTPSQNENFIALPCTGGGEDCSRTFDVPLEDADKDILIPVFTCAYNTAEIPEATKEQLLQEGRNDISDPVNLEATLDSNPLEKQYIETSVFEINVPSKHIMSDNILPGMYKAISVGYWARARDLSSGNHTITFGGTGRNGFHTKVVYNINIPIKIPRTENRSLISKSVQNYSMQNNL